MRKLFVILLAVSLLSCGTRGSLTKSGRSTSDTLYHNIYASHFTLMGGGDTTILKVNNPWQGAENVNKEFVITKPLERVVCMSSSYVAFLAELGLEDAIVGVSGLPFITNQKVHQNNVKDVGYDKALNYELILGLRPDAVLVFEVAGENSAITEKLRELGVPVIYIADYLESSPLGKAEWLIAFGAMTGRLDEALEKFGQIEQRYENVRREIAGSTGQYKPKVMLNSPYRDVWYVPGDRSYMVQLIRDAGGDYLAAGEDSESSRPISVEVAYRLMAEADFWLNPSGSVQSIADLKAADHRFAGMNVVRKENVYSGDARSTPAGGSDFWESGTVRPDLVLSDLAKIFHPEAMERYELCYYRRLQ